MNNRIYSHIKSNERIEHTILGYSNYTLSLGDNLTLFFGIENLKEINTMIKELQKIKKELEK